MYLHWNKIQKMGEAIFDELKNNIVLKVCLVIKVLDISWNEIGSITCASKICEFLKKNKAIVHLDLSNNKFDYKQSCLISEALNNNQTIYGFHFAGHYG